MSYLLNKTDGTILTELIDGQIDSNSTNLTLVGKNYTGYGEAFNENFIRLLENFANTSAPSNPLEGQVWWDKTSQKLQVFDGNQWKPSGAPFVQSTRPQLTAGDIWINNESNQVYAYDGNAENELILVGPSFSRVQGESGFVPFSILDTQTRSRTVLKLVIGGILVGVYSSLQFQPATGQAIQELVTPQNTFGVIYEGFNAVNRTTFKYYASALQAQSLISSDGSMVVEVDQILPSDRNGTTTGILTIKNNGGLTIGVNNNTVQKIVGENFQIENQILDQGISLRVRSSLYGSTIVDALRVDASTGRIGIFKGNNMPEYTVDITGDLRITGNLIVDGDSTTINVGTLEVEDRNVVIGKTSIPTDITANTGGITLLGSTEKTIKWISNTNSWTSNVSMDLDSGNTYKISGVDVLSQTTLMSSVTSAPGLTTIGELTSLTVDNITLNENTISSVSPMTISSTGPLTITSTSGLNINTTGNITLNSKKITGLAEPTAPSDATTKLYVDSRAITQDLITSFDITGLGTGSTLINNLKTFLNDLYPPDINNIGKLAKLHTISYTSATVSGINVTVRDVSDEDNGETLTVSRISVDSNGTKNESVLQDIESTNPTSGVVSLTPSRGFLVFESDGTQWIYDSLQSKTYP